MSSKGDENKNLQNLISNQKAKSNLTKDERHAKMRGEIDDMINAQVEHSEVEEVHIDEDEVRRQKYEAM